MRAPVNSHLRLGLGRFHSKLSLTSSLIFSLRCFSVPSLSQPHLTTSHLLSLNQRSTFGLRPASRQSFLLFSTCCIYLRTPALCLPSLATDFGHAPTFDLTLSLLPINLIINNHDVC